MKPVSFQYFAPSELAEVLELLQQYGDDAKVLAGGQSLMPMMNMRLVRPKVVIDINRVPGLDHISLTAPGGLNLGARTRQRAMERSELVKGWKTSVTAQKADHEARQRLWTSLITRAPLYQVFQSRTKRQIPLVFLTPETN